MLKKYFFFFSTENDFFPDVDIEVEKTPKDYSKVIDAKLDRGI